MKLLLGSGIALFALGTLISLFVLFVTPKEGTDKTEWYAGTACMLLVGIGEIVIALAIKSDMF